LKQGLWGEKPLDGHHVGTYSNPDHFGMEESCVWESGPISGFGRCPVVRLFGFPQHRHLERSFSRLVFWQYSKLLWVWINHCMYTGYFSPGAEWSSSLDSTVDLSHNMSLLPSIPRRTCVVILLGNVQTRDIVRPLQHIYIHACT
jgi:hypothetical protein